MTEETLTTDISTALKQIVNGFGVVTTCEPAKDLSTRKENYYAAGTISWMTQVSFDPSLVLIAIDKQSDLNETIGRSKNFALHLLHEGQAAWIEGFSGDSDVNEHSINGHPFESGETGAPIFSELDTFFECRVRDIHSDHGDHTLFVGEVIRAQTAESNSTPLCDNNTDYTYGG